MLIRPALGGDVVRVLRAVEGRRAEVRKVGRPADVADDGADGGVTLLVGDSDVRPRRAWARVTRRRPDRVREGRDSGGEGLRPDGVPVPGVN